jgi:predicted GNAT family N-acyltransferase
MTFREIAFGSADYWQACQLRRELLRKPIGLDFTNKDLAEERDQRHFGLFDDAGALMACAMATPLSAHAVRIRQMAVVAHCQRQGYGRSLLTGIERWLAQHGYTHVVLHARTSAVGFYAKQGYLPVGEVYVEVTLPHQTMEKTLGATDD